MQRAVGLGVGIGLLLGLTACAAMFNPAIQDVHVTSNRATAQVWVDGASRGTAPTILHLSTNERHEIVVKAQGKSMKWFLEPTMSREGAGGLVGDALVLVPTGTFAYFNFVAAQIPGNPLSTQNSLLAAGIVAVGLAPLVIDLATNDLYELKPATVRAQFE